jgi:hypothetical protein
MNRCMAAHPYDLSTLSNEKLMWALQCFEGLHKAGNSPRMDCLTFQDSLRTEILARMEHK